MGPCEENATDLVSSVLVLIYRSFAGENVASVHTAAILLPQSAWGTCREPAARFEVEHKRQPHC